MIVQAESGYSSSFKNEEEVFQPPHDSARHSVGIVVDLPDRNSGTHVDYRVRTSPFH